MLTEVNVGLFLVFHKVLHNSLENRKEVAGKPINNLTAENKLTHVGYSRQDQCQIS